MTELNREDLKECVKSQSISADIINLKAEKCFETKML